MGMEKSFRYKKFCYWVDHPVLDTLKENCKEKRIQLTREPRIPCRVLKPSIEMGWVAPTTWNSFCKRKTSWYWKSEKADRFLIVSNTPLDLPDFGHPILIKDSHFKPKRLPLTKEMLPLVLSEAYQAQKPSEWDKPNPLEKKAYQRWFERYQINEPFDFEILLRIHSANHANFLNPNYYVVADGDKIPYSIADSLHVCSSCLEFFNIIGIQWRVKYVTPCMGAVQFAHLPINHYFEVNISRILPIKKGS
jgi:hypothetical protein